MMMSEPTVASQSGIVRLDVPDRAALYAAYMPFVSNGGLFVSAQALGNTRYDLGSDVFLLLHLMEHNERLPIAGRVIWLTPSGGGMQRPPGVGIQFSNQDNGANQRRIETLLAGMLESDRPTHTL
ncbi:pilus biogenesis protein PilZ [Salinisphaera orenii MK-B5]|uniref:Pilus biogenesis protein PilZ n=2 Tax=Salinisphaera TaxID=180541 RepID=A0A423PKW1_9GAMM|nr:pilus biogenesis protein PilZ [Salinisphaera orenii MK-B5]